jgi:hypothetical protein
MCHVNLILQEIILKSVGCHKYFFVLENIGMMAVDLVKNGSRHSIVLISRHQNKY